MAMSILSSSSSSGVVAGSAPLTPLDNGNDNEILDLSFNRDGTSLSVGALSSCFHISVDNPEKPEKLEYGSHPFGVRILSRLGRSALVALVFVHTPRRLRLFNMIKNEEICSQLYKDSVLSVKITTLYMITCLEELIYTHSVKNHLSVLHAVKTSNNPRGIIAVCGDGAEEHLAAFPLSQESGEVQVMDASSGIVRRILALDQPIAAIEFNGDGKLLAVAGAEGTLIHVIATKDGTCLHKFYRGMSYVDIYSMKFSLNSKYLAVSSSNPTVHIFKLEEEEVKEMNKSSEQVLKEKTDATPADPEAEASYYNSLNSWFGWAKDTIVPMLPTSVSEAFSGANAGSVRAFATVRMPYKDVKSVVSITTSYTESGPEARVLVGAYDGVLYLFKLNEEGGDCTLLKQMDFLHSP